MQVKSGIVEQGCFSKVVGNWLLLDSVNAEHYTLFIENDLKIDISLLSFYLNPLISDIAIKW